MSEDNIQLELMKQLEELNQLSMVAQAGPRRQMLSSLSASPEKPEETSTDDLMAQLNQLNALAGQVQNQTENRNQNSQAPQSEADREGIYSELKKLLDRREILREKLKILEQREQLKKKLKQMQIEEEYTREMAEQERQEEMQTRRESNRHRREREERESLDDEGPILECDVGFNVRDQVETRQFSTVDDSDLPAAASSQLMPPKASISKKAGSLMKGIATGLGSKMSPAATSRNSPAVNVNASPVTRRAVHVGTSPATHYNATRINATNYNADYASPAPTDASLELEVEALARQLAELDSLSSLGTPTTRMQATRQALLADETELAMEMKVGDLLGQLALLDSLTSPK